MHTNTSQFISVWLGKPKNSAVNPEGAAPTGVLTDLEMYTGVCLSSSFVAHTPNLHGFVFI